MKECIVIPFYNHPRAISGVLDALAPLDLRCWLIDDGSDAASQSVLAELALRHRKWLTIERLPVNQGKGGAVMAGCELALRAGYTHAVQVDADGQHDLNDIPRFLTAARQNPDALVSGAAVYDESVPRSRLYGRYLTHVWVWINTLSFEIADSLCGLRVYPLATACELWRRARLGRRMDFDVEIMVRMSWQGAPIICLPTQVHYPLDGVSHFDLVRDNVRISAMHARLFCGMLARLPILLGRRVLRRLRRVEKAAV